MVSKKIRCQVCHSECRPLRCSRCLNAFYCSVGCQRIDWKSGGHRRSCSRINLVQISNGGFANSREGEVGAALKELHSFAQGLSIDQLQEEYHKARDEVERQGKFQKAKAVALPSPKLTAKTSKQDNPGIVEGNPICEQIVEPTDATHHGSSKIGSEKFGYDVVVEDMYRISRYQVSLTPCQYPRRPLSSDSIELSIDSNCKSTTLVSIFSNHDFSVRITFELPKVVLQPSTLSSSTDADGTILFRLAYEDEDDSWDGRILETAESRLLTPTVINSMQCKFCGLSLLPHKTIEEAVQLPSGYWDEISDYLICYSGQPAVDFTSSALHAQKNVAMQDSNVVCLHKDDVGPQVCILAVNGYGEEDENTPKDFRNVVSSLKPDDNPASALVRGDRPWVDAVGGATICCSLCCSPLGYASIESPITFRFLKHRFSVRSSHQMDKIGHRVVPMSACSSFVARELVRYAETKAIFTFIVGVDSSEPVGRRRCLLLRVLSWDAVLATTYETSSSQRLHFDRVAKIVYEETYNKLATRDNKNISSWVWGGVDLCCLPRDANITGDNKSFKVAQKSAVRLQLPQEEWEEVRLSLIEGNRWFSKSVSDATILVTMGQNVSTEGRKLGLSAIPLNL